MCVFAAGGMNSRSGSTLWRRAPPSPCWLLPLERISSGELKTLPHASSAIPRGSVHGEKLETQRRWCDTMHINCGVQVFFFRGRLSYVGRATLRALARSRARRASPAELLSQQAPPEAMTAVATAQTAIAQQGLITTIPRDHLRSLSVSTLAAGDIRSARSSDERGRDRNRR
jgi:hypothetical protein